MIGCQKRLSDFARQWYAPGPPERLSVCTWVAYLVNTSYPETLSPTPESTNQQPTRASADGTSSLFKFHLHHHLPPVTLKNDRTSKSRTRAVEVFQSYHITLILRRDEVPSLPDQQTKSRITPQALRVLAMDGKTFVRSVVLAAQTSSIEASLILFCVYRMHSDHWPATFRPVPPRSHQNRRCLHPTPAASKST